LLSEVLGSIDKVYLSIIDENDTSTPHAKIGFKFKVFMVPPRSSISNLPSLQPFSFLRSSA
jgi:hypothetical protein